VLLERTLGLAAANALFNTFGATDSLPECSSTEGDLLDVLALTKDDKVGMVGFFGPLAPVIKQRAGELIVFEENMARSEGLCPGASVAELLPTCSVAIITATSIINNSFEHIAAAAANCRIKAVLGPSTPLAPGVFKDYGVTHLSGVISADAAAILRVVSEAGGTRFFMKWSKKNKSCFQRLKEAYELFCGVYLSGRKYAACGAGDRRGAYSPGKTMPRP
jgi:uncharacterized protein (DUF4213/DUF364 family)